MDGLDDVDFNKIPAPLNSNERIVYFNSPPLKIELGDTGNNIIITKILENSIDVPIGSILTYINDDDVSTKSTVECLKILRKWNKSGSSGSPILLKFVINTNYNEIHDHNHLTGFDPVKSFLLRELSEKSKITLGISLHSTFLQKICNLHGWESSIIVPRIERLMQDYLQLKSNYVSPLLLSSSSSTSSSLNGKISPEQNIWNETDILDNIQAAKGSPAPPVDTDDDYVVSLLSRQLGMTIENVLERTIVRSVHPNSEAFRLNVRTNSIILNIGSASTIHQTHLETLESLKNTVRPVKLRLCKVDETVLSTFRTEMHALVSRSKSLIEDVALHFTTLEKQTLWIFEIYALAECIASCQLEQNLHTRALFRTTSTENERESDLKEGDNDILNFKDLNNATMFNTVAENNFCRKRALICLERSLKILDAYELTRQSINENERRGNLYHLRWTSLTEAMYDIRETFDWNSCQLYSASNAPDSTSFQLNSNMTPIIDIPPIDLITETLRHITLSLLQLSSEQQEQQIFPDRATCDVLDRIVRNTMTPRLILSLHIPALWKLAGSSAVPARIACANLIPLIYCHLSSLQRIRIRGLLNRLLVDTVSEVRAYVLSSVCVRIMRSIVTKKVAEKFIEHESITLNWISHCMVQGSTDIEMDMRKASLLLCKNMVEYSSLGQSDAAEVNDIVNEMHISISDDRTPSTFSPELVILPSISDIHIMFCRALPIISRLVEDSEAEIRGSVVSMCGDFCIWMGGKWSAVLLDVLLCCFRDSIPDVRASALTAVPHAVLALIQAAIKSSQDSSRDQTISKLFISLIPAVCSMSKDTSMIVRISLCTALARVLSLLYTITINGHLKSYSFIPMLQNTMCEIVIQLLEDKINQVAIQMVTELCLSINKEYIYNYNSYIALIFTEENLLVLIRCIKYFSKLPSWRIRKLICVVIPKLVNACQTVENRSLVSDIIIPLLYDPVFSVRQSAATSMCIASISDFEKDRYQNNNDLNDIQQVNNNNNNNSNNNSNNTNSKGKKNKDNKNDKNNNNKNGNGNSSSNNNNKNITSNGEPIQDMGRMWLDCVVLPQLESLRTSRIYSNRILSLHMIITLLYEKIVLYNDVRYNILVNIALTLSHDPIPNVRIALGEILGVLVQLLQSNKDEKLMMNNTQQQNQQHQHIWDITINALELLSNDSDKDVKYYANKAKEFLKTNQKSEINSKLSLFNNRIKSG